jgi:hypothetical protein
MVFRACNYLFQAKLTEPEEEKYEENPLMGNSDSGFATGTSANAFFQFPLINTDKNHFMRTM